MTHFRENHPNVPLLPISVAILAVINTSLTLLIAFGLELSAEQQSAILATVNSLVVLIVALSHARRSVGTNHRLIDLENNQRTNRR